jgi:hypothetical protein
MPDQGIPLPTAPAPCWRCGAPSSREGLRYDLCPTCLAMLDEIAARYQGPQATPQAAPCEEDFG